jgi:hypothetical protein
MGRSIIYSVMEGSKKMKGWGVDGGKGMWVGTMQVDLHL